MKQKDKLSKLALKGENVIIAKAGKPIVQLIAYKEPVARKFGQFKGQLMMKLLTFLRALCEEAIVRHPCIDLLVMSR